jgi:hypothetical protein
MWNPRMEMTILPLALYMFILSYTVCACALPVLRLWPGRSSPLSDVTAPSGARAVGHGCPGCGWAELAPAVCGCGPAKYGRRQRQGARAGERWWSEVEDDLDPSVSGRRRRRADPTRGQAGATPRAARPSGPRGRGERGG